MTAGLGAGLAGSPSVSFGGFGTGGPFGGAGVERGPGGLRGAVTGGRGETVVGRAGARGASGMGVAPAGGRAEGDEDKEHKAAEYLCDFHDEFWYNSPPVAPAVIGDEEDED